MAADLAQLQTWLTEAQTRRHTVAMGEGVLEVWRDGRRIIYSQANIEELDQYILSLQQQIEMLTNEAAGLPKRSAIGVSYW